MIVYKTDEAPGAENETHEPSTPVEAAKEVDTSGDDGDTTGQHSQQPSAGSYNPYQNQRENDGHLQAMSDIIKMSMRGVMCALCCCLPIANAVHICALVFAFESTFKEQEDIITMESEEYDVCGTDWNPGAFMSVSRYLLIAGAGGIAAVTIFMVSILVLYRRFLKTLDLAVSEGGETDTFNRHLQGLLKYEISVRFCSLPVMCLELGWSTAAFILYSQVGEDCTDTSQAKMMLAWGIISILNGCQRFNQLSRLKMKDTFSTLFASTNAMNSAL